MSGILFLPADESQLMHKQTKRKRLHNVLFTETPTAIIAAWLVLLLLGHIGCASGGFSPPEVGNVKPKQKVPSACLSYFGYKYV